MLVEAYKAACQAVSSVARDFNLIAIDQSALQGLEKLAGSDVHAANFSQKLTDLLNQYAKSLDVRISSDLLSLYGEALVYWLLHDRIKIEPIPAGPVSAADFRCELNDGRAFFLEVKTLEYSGGTSTQKNLQAETMSKQIEAEQRAKDAAPSPTGIKVGMSELEVSPLGNYKRGSKLLYEIKTLIHRLHGRFKGSQFNAGPTFAVAPLVRLSPARMRIADALDLLAMYPYFRAPLEMGSDRPDHRLSAYSPVLPGRLWHVAFGEPGALMADVPDSEGNDRLPEPNRLDDFGLLVPHGTRYIGAAGLIFIEAYNQDVPFGRNVKEHLLLGLFDPKYTAPDWDDIATQDAMHAMGVLWNDARDSRGSFYV